MLLLLVFKNEKKHIQSLTNHRISSFHMAQAIDAYSIDLQHLHHTKSNLTTAVFCCFEFAGSATIPFIGCNGF